MKKHTWKHLLSTLLTLVILCCAMSGCTQQAAQQPTPQPGTQAPGPDAETPAVYHWSIGLNTSKGNPPYNQAFRFKELMEERSRGAVTITLYPDGQMGGDNELTESVIAGTLDFYCGTTAQTASYVTAAAVLDGHWEYDSMDHYRRMMDSGFRDILNAEYAKANMHIVGFAEAGMRQLMSNKDIASVADMGGLKVRIMQNKYHIAAWSALGASPTPMDWGETYVGLQQKMIDAVEMSYPFISSAKLYEVQDHMLLTNHLVQPAVLFMRNDLYESLPDDIRAMVDECGKEAQDDTRRLLDEQEKDLFQEILDNGVTVTEMSPELKAEISELMKPANDLIKEDVGSEFYEQYVSFREATR